VTNPPRKIEPRLCIACAADFGTDGALPWAADVHLVNGEMVVTCSPPCRTKLGLSERKLK
jgi:hypothetical protein